MALIVYRFYLSEDLFSIGCLTIFAFSLKNHLQIHFKAKLSLALKFKISSKTLGQPRELLDFIEMRKIKEENMTNSCFLKVLETH